MNLQILLLDCEVSRQAYIFEAPRSLTAKEAVDELNLDSAWLEEGSIAEVRSLKKPAFVPTPDSHVRKVLNTVPGVATFVEVAAPRYHVALWKDGGDQFQFHVLQAEHDLKREDFIRAGANLPADTGFVTIPKIERIVPVPSLAGAKVTVPFVEGGLTQNRSR
jgi:hypothetical protein